MSPQVIRRNLSQKPVAPLGQQLALEDRPAHRPRAVRHRRRAQPFLAELAKALRLEEAALLPLLFDRRRSSLADRPLGVDAQLSRSSERQPGRAVLAEGDSLAPPIHPVVQPSRAGYINAVQIYPFAEGALYQVYTSPGEITDIALQEGEQLVGSGPVAAGDTVRWIIGDTESGVGASRKTHIMIKPTRPDLMTNLVINTDRRTYHLELRATEKTYMASVSWQYPQDELIALRRRNATAEEVMPVDTGVDLGSLNFRYAIEGDAAPWRPLRAFDDGRKVYIEFPRGISQGEMPPLFVIGASGDSQLVNYRVRGPHMVIDRLFAAAELRFGSDDQRVVRIIRSDGRPAI
jgi:type IV secretion system protein VirB9